MQSSEIIQHPIIEVLISGVMVSTRAVCFELKTNAGCHASRARLTYPADSDVGTVGDRITVSLVLDEKTDLYFTGVIYSTSICGAARELFLTDSYKKLCDTVFTAAYRKEKAANILDDILGAAEIAEKAVSLPDVELARFSTQTIPAWLCIDLLIDALKEHGVENLVYFFDEKDTFHFGTENDTGKNEGEIFQFESAKNILKRGAGWIEVLPHPVRHTQKITIDGKEEQTISTDLVVSRKLSRLTLWAKEAA